MSTVALQYVYNIRHKILLKRFTLSVVNQCTQYTETSRDLTGPWKGRWADKKGVFGKLSVAQMIFVHAYYAHSHLISPYELNFTEKA